MRLSRSILLAILVVLLILGSGPTFRAAIAVNAQALSVQSIYAHLQATLAASGNVYHVVVTEKDSGAAARAPQKEQVWVDGAHDVARQLVTYSATDFFDTFYLKHVTVEALHLSSRGGRRQFTVTSPFPTCHSTGIVASLLIGCPLYLDDNPIGDTAQNLTGYSEQAMTATYGGRPAILLQVHGVISNADGTFPSTAKLYLNPTTFLPIARVTTTSGFAAGVQTTLATFAITAVNPSTFPRNFFDPASIGYRGIDAVMSTELAQVPSSFPVYWLGMHWKGTSVLGPLALSYVDRYGPHRLGLSYTPDAHRVGAAAVQMYENTSGSRWPALLPAGPCVSRQRIALSGGYGIILSPRTGSGCTGSGSAAAVATLGKLRITVIPTFKVAGAQQQTRYRRYATVAGLKAVLKALFHRSADGRIAAYSAVSDLRGSWQR